MCGSSEELMVKYVVDPEEGGKNVLSNGITLCAKHYYNGLGDEVLKYREECTTRLNLEIDRTAYLEFRELCQSRDETLSGKVRQLIAEYLREQGGKTDE
jgi:hypothetical protein